MYTKIPLRVKGFDLRVDAAAVPEDLDEVFLTSHGAITLAVVYTQDADPLGAAEDAARRIAKALPGARAIEVHDELATITDIAHRCAVAAEAVRLWASGKRRRDVQPFPGPRQVIGTSGGKSMNLYAWREVLRWVRTVIGIDPDEDVNYLGDEQILELNHALHRAAAWTPVTLETKAVSSPNSVATSSSVAYPVAAHSAALRGHGSLNSANHVTSPLPQLALATR
ncbi:MAG: hypothetical protein JWO60_3130 [Frankiales bacterium]|nr:hypothetical protein [Frankiales bacterium]